MAASPADDCTLRSANVLNFDPTNFATFCVALDNHGNAKYLAAYLNAVLGNLSGFDFDSTYYRVAFGGAKAFLAGFAGNFFFDSKLERSYMELPLASLGSVVASLQAWAANPSNPPFTVLNRFNVRDVRGCLIASVDYAALADFVFVSNCATLVP